MKTIKTFTIFLLSLCPAALVQADWVDSFDDYEVTEDIGAVAKFGDWFTTPETGGFVHRIVDQSSVEGVKGKAYAIEVAGGNTEYIQADIPDVSGAFEVELRFAITSCQGVNNLFALYLDSPRGVPALFIENFAKPGGYSLTVRDPEANLLLESPLLSFGDWVTLKISGNTTGTWKLQILDDSRAVLFEKDGLEFHPDFVAAGAINLGGVRWGSLSAKPLSAVLDAISVKKK